MRFLFGSAFLFLSSSLLTTTTTVAAAKGSADESGPPPFFLQDPSDSLCLAGEDFKRCSIDTLFYVVGSPGTYQIHKRPVGGVGTDDDDDGTCIAKKSCKDSDADKLMEVKVTKCSHCGAKNWNVLGDAEQGYVITQGGSGDDDDDEADDAKQTCLFRQGDKAMTAPCDSEEIAYTPLQLRFASAADIKTMSSPGARLIVAASDGDIPAIEKLIKEDKIDINSRDWDELTALVPAASAGHLDTCKYLIENGIDVNAADKDGITALMEASIMGHTDIVKYLIEKGAKVEAEATSEVTALWLAASEGQTSCMQILLDHGASATNTRVDGITALMTAAVGGHAEAVKLLIDKGADPTTADKEGLTPLMNAAENGTLPVLQILAEAGDKDPAYLDAISNSGFSALIIASAHGHAPAVEFLLSAGANVEASADNDVTALMFAAASNHVEVVKILLEKGNAKIDARHSNGGTALLEAATGGAVDCIKLLLEKGAQVDLMDDDGVTPLMAIASQGSAEGMDVLIDALKATKSDAELKDFINLFSKSGGSTVMFATAGGHAESTRKLLALGADANAIAKATPDYLEKLKKMIEEGTVQEEEHVDGVTALHVAAQGGHLEVVKILIDEAKVDVTIKDEDSRTALLLAIKGNYGEVASTLVAAGADPNTVYVDDDGEEHNLLFDSIMVENTKFAKLLIEKGADLYYQDEKKVTTLLQASHRGLVEVVQALLDKNSKGAEFVDSASEEGISPLIAASSEGHDEVVKILIAAKADVNAVDKDQTTALMAASARGHLDVVKELLAAGAKVNEQNSDGHTALMFAYNGKNQVETLWERYSEYIKDTKTGGQSEEEVDDSGTGSIIREAFDNHLALVDLLMKNGADASLKDKEGHTAKDFDYNPDLDSEVIDKEAKAEKIRDESKYEL